MTDDQKARKAEFDRLFPLMPGRTNADKLRNVCLVADVKPGTVRQWRMETPPRYPSWQVIKLMRQGTGQAA